VLAVCENRAHELCAAVSKFGLTSSLQVWFCLVEAN
jgi:hypothetical protein